MAMQDRPPVPEEWVRRIADVLTRLPECTAEPAWVWTRWQIGGATVAHVFGGEDQLFRITFRGELDEVMAFEHLGPPYFRASWGANVIGVLLDDGTDWTELAELLTDSYCLVAPKQLANRVARPDR